LKESVLVAVLLAALWHPLMNQDPPASPTPKAFKAFAVYVLSRGKGVPPAADEALRKVQDLLEADRKRGIELKFEMKSIGIEGEMRLCAEYVRAEDAQRTFDKAKAIVKGVELTNLVVESCAQRSGGQERNEP
jgi:hypothetical protein